MRWYINLRTNVKLISSFLVIAALLACVGVFGLSNVSKMNTKVNNMYNNVAVPINTVLQAQVAYTRLRVSIRDLNMADSAGEKQDIVDQTQSDRQGIETGINTYKQSVLTDDDKTALQPFDSAWASYKDAYDKAVQLGMDGKNDELSALIRGELKTKGDTLRDVLNNIVAANMKDADAAIADSQKAYGNSRTIIIALIAAAVVLSIVFGYWIARMIAGPLGRMVELVGRIARGDLREKIGIDSKDEIGQLAVSVNGMVENLRTTIGHILTSSQSVAAAAEQISASTEEIAGGSADQANAAQTINELFKDLSAAIHSVAQNTEHASELSDQAMKAAREGNHIIQSSMQSMGEVNDQMSRLENDSQQIGEIIEVIEDIADQTNLLALNAAIEAARAGEQGRGFAVVADEVRKLAERSGEATKQIASIIKGMQNNTRHCATAVQESSTLSRQSGESFQQIAAMVSETSQKVAEIAAASEEQAAQTSAVLHSAENISAVTEEAAAASEETAATAQSLAQLATDLQQSVSFFQVS